VHEISNLFFAPRPTSVTTSRSAAHLYAVPGLLAGIHNARPVAPRGLLTSLASLFPITLRACPAPLHRWGPPRCRSATPPLASARGCPGDLPAQQNLQHRDHLQLRSQHLPKCLASSETACVKSKATMVDRAAGSTTHRATTGHKPGIGFFGSFRYSPSPGERGARARGHDRGIHRGTPKPLTGREPAHGRFAGHGLGTGHRLGTGRGDDHKPAPYTHALLQDPQPNARQGTF
jgi:hypothetical protein